MPEETTRRTGNSSLYEDRPRVHKGQEAEEQETATTICFYHYLTFYIIFI